MLQVLTMWPKFKEWVQVQHQMRSTKRKRDPLAE
jgi:hypothetical protein